MRNQKLTVDEITANSALIAMLVTNLSGYLREYYGGLEDYNSHEPDNRIPKLNAKLSSIVKGQFVTSVSPSSSDYPKLVALIQEVLSEKNNGKDYMLLLGHLYFLIGDTESCTKWLKTIEDEKFDEEFRESDVEANFSQYCMIKKQVMLSLVTKNEDLVTPFLSSSLSSVPSASNIQGRFWLHVLFNTYFKDLCRDALVSFEIIEERLKENPLIMMVLCCYFYRHFKKRLTSDFKRSFTSYFKSFVDEHVYTNENLRFPNSKETNYPLESMISMISDVIKDELFVPSYGDVSDPPANDSLIDLDYFESLVRYAVGKTFQSIKVFNSLIFVKIALFNQKNQVKQDSAANYRMINQIIAIIKNFKAFHDQHFMRLDKSSTKTLDHNYIQTIETYTVAIEFFTNNITSFSTFSSINRSNVTFLNDLSKGLADDIESVLKIIGVQSATLLSSNLLNPRLELTKRLTLVLSKGYHALISKQLFDLKADKQLLDKFLASNELKNETLNNFKICLALNDFSNLSWYTEYISHVIRFDQFEKYSQSLLQLVKKVLSKNFNYWECWNMLLILLNSDCGIKVANDEKLPASFDGLNVVVNEFIKSSKLLTVKDPQFIHKLKYDLVQLKITELIIYKKQHGAEACLAKLPELFDLVNVLFKEFLEVSDFETSAESKQKNGATTNGVRKPNAIRNGNAEKAAEKSFSSGSKILRFATLRRKHKPNTVESKKELSSLTVVEPAESILRKEGAKFVALNRKTSPSVEFFSNIIQKVWLFAGSLYLELKMEQEAISCLKEAEEHCVNELTLALKARIKSKFANDVKKKLEAFNEFENSIDFLNKKSLTNAEANYDGIIGLAHLVLEESEIQQRIEASDEDTLANLDIFNADSASMDDDNEEPYPISDSDTFASTKFAALTTEQLEFNNKEPELIFINENDKTLKLLRVKSLIENHLVSHYHYFNDPEVWNCVQRVYCQLEESSKYEHALEKTIYLSENELVRNLRFLDN